MSCIAPRCGAPRELGALFCTRHMTAPPGQRGGWLSAHRRRKKMSNHALETLDANCVAKRLWVGAAPPTDRDLPQFQALVLCAVEYQPEFPFYRGAILRCRLRDSNLSRFEADHALVGGQWVATALSNGKTVLVTCQAGINRSALVASVALGMLNRRATPEQIMDRIRRTRNPDCLSNPDFQRFLKQYLKR